MKRLVALLLAVAIAAVLSGCGAHPPASPADIRGVVTSLSAGSDGSLSLRIVWDKSLGTQLTYDAAQASVTSKTRVYKAVDGRIPGAAKVSSSELRVRDVVEAWFTGMVRESYPVQVDAKSIVIVGEWDSGQPLPSPPGLSPPDTAQ